MEQNQEHQEESPRPVWSRPEVSVLDVEQGTVAMSGFYADGFEASTS